MGLGTLRFGLIDIVWFGGLLQPLKVGLGAFDLLPGSAQLGLVRALRQLVVARFGGMIVIGGLFQLHGGRAAIDAGRVCVISTVVDALRMAQLRLRVQQRGFGIGIILALRPGLHFIVIGISRIHSRLGGVKVGLAWALHRAAVIRVCHDQGRLGLRQGEFEVRRVKRREHVPLLDGIARRHVDLGHRAGLVKTQLYFGLRLDVAGRIHTDHQRAHVDGGRALGHSVGVLIEGTRSQQQ